MKNRFIIIFKAKESFSQLLDHIQTFPIAIQHLETKNRRTFYFTYLYNLHFQLECLQQNALSKHGVEALISIWIFASLFSIHFV